MFLNSLSSLNKYVHNSSLTAGGIHPMLSFHGLVLSPADFCLVDAAAMGGICWRGLWVYVCLRGPAGRNQMKLTFLDKLKVKYICAQCKPSKLSAQNNMSKFLTSSSCSKFRHDQNQYLQRIISLRAKEKLFPQLWIVL